MYHVRTKRDSAPIFSLHLNAMLHKLPSLFPWKHNKTKVMAETVLEEEVYLKEDLQPCYICGRTFLPKPLEKHSRICEKNATQKRKIFNSLKQRVEGTDLAPFHQQTILKKPEIVKPKAPEIKHWKENHRRLVNAIREAKDSSPRLTKPRSMSIVNNNCERCPCCERQFGPKAYDRHVEWCKERQARLPQSPANIQQAKERLDARINYKVPNMSKPKKTVREKYQSPLKAENLSTVKSMSCLERKPSIRKTSSCHIELPKERFSRQDSNKNDNVPVVKKAARSPEPKFNRSPEYKNNRSPEPKNKKVEAIIKNVTNKRVPTLKINSPQVNKQLLDMHISQLNTPMSPTRRLVTWKDTIHPTPGKLLNTSKLQEEVCLKKLKAVKSETTIPPLNLTLEGKIKLPPIKTKKKIAIKICEQEKTNRNSDSPVTNKKLSTISQTEPELNLTASLFNKKFKKMFQTNLDKSIQIIKKVDDYDKEIEIDNNSSLSSISSPRNKRIKYDLKANSNRASKLKRKASKNIKRNVYLEPTSPMKIPEKYNIGDLNKSCIQLVAEDKPPSNTDKTYIALSKVNITEQKSSIDTQIQDETANTDVLEFCKYIEVQSSPLYSPKSDTNGPLASEFYEYKEENNTPPQSERNLSIDVAFEEIKENVVNNEKNKLNHLELKDEDNMDDIPLMQRFEIFCGNLGIHFNKTDLFQSNVLKIENFKEFISQHELSIKETSSNSYKNNDSFNIIKENQTTLTLSPKPDENLLKKNSIIKEEDSILSDSSNSPNDSCDEMIDNYISTKNMILRNNENSDDVDSSDDESLKISNTNQNLIEIKSFKKESEIILNEVLQRNDMTFEYCSKTMKPAIYQPIEYEIIKTEKSQQLSLDNNCSSIIFHENKPIILEIEAGDSFLEVRDISMQVDNNSSTNADFKEFLILQRLEKFSTAAADDLTDLQITNSSDKKDSQEEEINEIYRNFSDNLFQNSISLPSTDSLPAKLSTLEKATSVSSENDFFIENLNFNNIDKVIFESNNEIGNLESFHGFHWDVHSVALSKARLQQGLRSCCSDVEIAKHAGIENYATYSDTDLTKFSIFQNDATKKSNIEQEAIITSDKILEIEGKKEDIKELNSPIEEINNEKDNIVMVEETIIISDDEVKPFSDKIFESCLNENIRKINQMKTNFFPAIPNLKNITIQETVEIYEVDDYIMTIPEESRSGFDTAETRREEKEEYINSFRSQSTNSLTSAQSSNPPVENYSPRFLSLINMILDDSFGKKGKKYLKLTKEDCKRILKANPKKIKKIEGKNKLKLPNIHHDNQINCGIKKVNQGNVNRVVKLPKINNKREREFVPILEVDNLEENKFQGCGDLLAGLSNYRNRPTDNPFEVAERQLMELLDCDIILQNKNSTPIPSKSKINPKPITENKENFKNLKQSPIADITSSDSLNIFEDNFELIENFINDNYNNENLLQNLNFDTISLCSNKTMTLNDKESNYQDEDLSIDPSLINEYDNLSIPENYLGDDTSPSESLIQVKSSISNNKAVNKKNIDLNFLPTDKKYKKSIKYPEQKSQTIISSSFRRSPSPQEKKIPFVSLKRSTSILDPVKPKTLNSRHDVEAHFESHELREVRNHQPKIRPKNMASSDEFPNMEELFSVDDDMYEEYKRYEQVYLREKEEKMRMERAHEEEDGGRKLCGDSAYGSLSRSKPKVRTRVAKLSPLEHRVDSASSSGSEQSSKQEMNNCKMTKFCHECGNRYPVSTAKFCVECGIRRLVL